MGKTSGKAKILYGEGDAEQLQAHLSVMEKAGYSVKTVVGRRTIEEAMRQDKYDLVVLGHTLTRDDRHHLPYMAKKADPDIKVLVLHASGRHHEVDLSLDSRDGMDKVLRAVESLMESRMAVTV